LAQHRDQRLLEKIDLGASASKLARSYEQGNAVAIWYPRESLPRDDQWVEDARYMATLLRQLYEAEDQSVAPYSRAPAVAMAEAAVSDLARPLSKNGRRSQGRGLSRAEIVAVELQAMAITRNHFEQLGYEVTDVSAVESYDFRASKGSAETLLIEVKGTTGGAAEILLTASEVKLHQRAYPNNALSVVHGIRLNRDTETPMATGGEMTLLSPWLIDEGRLTPTAFRYAVVTQSALVATGDRSPGQPPAGQ
jgi:hypothetical protein